MNLIILLTRICIHLNVRCQIVQPTKTRPHYSAYYSIICIQCCISGVLAGTDLLVLGNILESMVKTIHVKSRVIDI